MVGPRTDLYDNVAGTFNDNHTYADPNFGQRHDALWGRSLTSAADHIAETVTAHQPEYLLVLLGINDLAWGVSDRKAVASRGSRADLGKRRPEGVHRDGP